jgi:hypothetical protein
MKEQITRIKEDLMPLKGKQFEALSEALLSAFTYSTLQMMLRSRFEKRLDQITRSANLQTVIYDLISAAEREGWVYDLAREAHDWVPGNPDLAAVAASFSPAVTTISANGVEAQSSPAVPTIDPDNPPIRHIRKLLKRSYSAETLRRFCSDRPAFQEVLLRIGPNEGLEGVIDEVLEKCRTSLLWQELLAGVKEDEPEQYKRFLKDVKAA